MTLGNFKVAACPLISDWCRACLEPVFVVSVSWRRGLSVSSHRRNHCTKAAVTKSTTGFPRSARRSFTICAASAAKD